MATNPQIESNKTRFIDDETKSLFQLGFVAPLDYIIFGTLVIVGFAGLVWAISARPDFVYIIAVLLCLQFLVSIWAITLMYRACYFTLKMRAVMETMPEIAAQIAFKIHEQRLNSIGKQGEPMPSGSTK